MSRQSVNAHRLSAILVVLAAAILVQLLSPALVEAKGKKEGWKVIGIKSVAKKLERDVIRVGAKKGTFNQVRIQVTKAPLKISRFIIHFEGDDKQVVPLGQDFEEGTTSRIIRLKSGKRKIDKVVLWYEKGSSEGEKATVAVWGRKK